MIRASILFLAFVPSLCLAEPKKRPTWTEYEARFHCYEGQQPVVTLRWWSMDVAGPSQEYPEIWRKGMKFGIGNRFRVESLTGVDQDGKKKAGQVVTAEVLDTQTSKKITFRSDRPTLYLSFTDEWMKKRLLKFPPKKTNAEQAGTGQSATRPESKSEGGDKPQPEAEGRSR
jgi:hypothetical protein